MSTPGPVRVKLAQRARFGVMYVRRLAGLAPRTPMDDPDRTARLGALADASPSADWFASDWCQNCGALRTGKFCADCGQGKSQRFDVLAVGSEAWQNYRWFDMSLLRGVLAALRAPGRVAREFVLGARKRHLHPLKLLLVVIAGLVLVLSQSTYLDSRDAGLSQAMALVRTYGNWSFSIGIVAIVLATQVVWRWRQPFNLTEHLVLGVYLHASIIAVSLLNLLPTLMVRDPFFLAAHKAASGWYMDGLEALIVVMGCRQFFRLRWRQDFGWLLLAVAIFVVSKMALLRLYALLVVKLVLYQLAATPS